MFLNDMSKPLTAQLLNETAAKRFGKRLKLEKFNMEQLYDVRNRLRTSLYQVETNESYNSVTRGDKYNQDKMFLDIINAEIKQREAISINESRKKTEKKGKIKRKKDLNKTCESKQRVLRETDEQEAELIMAAKDMVDKLTGWMEHTSQMQSETMLSLGDAIRVERGSKESHQFINVIEPALDDMYDIMNKTRNTLIDGVEMLTGNKPIDMGYDDDEEDLGDIGSDDMFGASEASKGGTSPEGRERRESIDRSIKKKF